MRVASEPMSLTSALMRYVTIDLGAKRAEDAVQTDRVAVLTPSAASHIDVHLSGLPLVRLPSDSWRGDAWTKAIRTDRTFGCDRR